MGKLLGDRPLAIEGGPNPGRGQTGKTPGGNNNTGGSGKKPEPEGKKPDKQPEGNQPSTETPDNISLDELSRNLETTYGKNAPKKFRKHIDRLRKLTGAEIGKKVTTSSETQKQVKDAINDVVRNGEARQIPWGKYDDAIWSRKGDAIVIRQSNGEFVTILDGKYGKPARVWK